MRSTIHCAFSNSGSADWGGVRVHEGGRDSFLRAGLASFARWDAVIHRIVVRFTELVGWFVLSVCEPRGVRWSICYSSPSEHRGDLFIVGPCVMVWQFGNPLNWLGCCLAGDGHRWYAVLNSMGSWRYSCQLSSWLVSHHWQLGVMPCWTWWGHGVMPAFVWLYQASAADSLCWIIGTRIYVLLLASLGSCVFELGDWYAESGPATASEASFGCC